MRIEEDGGIHWGDRLPKRLLVRLYQDDAAGMVDEALLDEVGIMLFERCADILYIHDYLNGHFRCPWCEIRIGRGAEMVESPKAASGDDASQFQCPTCGFSIAKGDMRASFRKQQLNPGGAVPYFEQYVTKWRMASEATEKMMAIDAVIHAFHYSLKRNPDLPTRAAGVNLIEGHLGDVVAFLNELSNGRDDENRDRFRQELAKNLEWWNECSGRRTPSLAE